MDRQIEALVLNWIVEQGRSFLAEHRRLLSTNESWRRAGCRFYRYEPEVSVPS